MAMDTGSNYSSYLSTGTWNHNIGYGPWTITAWIRSNDLRSTNQRYLFYGSAGPFIILSADGNSPSSSPYVYSSGGAGSFGIKFQDGGKWQHFLVTRTSVAGGQFLCYIDGIRATTGVSAPAGSYNFPNDSYQIYGIFGNRVRDFGLFGCTATPQQVQEIASGRNACSVLSNCKGYFPIRGSTPAALVRDVGPLRLASTAVGTLTPYADGISAEKSPAHKRRVVGVVSVTVVDISGTVTFTFSPTGAIVGQGVVATSSTVAFAPLGTIVGLADLSTSSSVNFTPTATGVGLADLSSSSSVVFTPTATITGLADLTSSSVLTFTSAASLDGLAELASSTSLSFAAVASLAASVDLAASSTLTFSASSDLVGLGSVSASSAFAFDSASALTGFAVVQGSSLVMFAGTGTTFGSATFSGSASLAFVPTATVSGVGVAVGSSALSFVSTGDVVGILDLSGSVSATFTVTSSLYAIGVVSGSCTVTFTTNAHPDAGTRWYAECTPDFLLLTTFVCVVSEFPSTIETESVLLQRISFESELVLSLEFDSVMLEESTTQLRTGWYDG